LDSIGLPCGVNSVDPISFAFHHKQKYFGTDVAHPDYIAPELARDLARNTLGRRQIGLHEERFALYALAFHILCGASPIAYSGGRPEPAERAARREFSIHNLPAGAKAPAGVIADWNSLPDALRAVILTGLTAEPANRPSPQKLREELLPIAATPSPSPHHAGSPAQGLGPWPFDGAVALAWARRNRWAFGAAGLLALAASLAATSPGSSTPAPAVAPPRAASATIPRVVIPPPARPPTDPDSLRWLLGTGPQAGPATPRRIVIPPPTRPPTDPDSLRILLGTN
jgi:hypothetical protein